MDILRQVRVSLIMVLLLTLLTGIAYPLVVTGLGQVLLPAQANGSLIRDDKDNVIGATLIGQGFSGAGYFHPRPSAAGSGGFDPLSSGGSNLGPTNQQLIDTFGQRAAAYRMENRLSADATVPVDAVTTSASGLDPDISPANAILQATRVATARGMPEADVRALVERHTQERVLGFLGERRVNVLELNLDLDRKAGQ